jgi:hypothetical protein
MQQLQQTRHTKLNSPQLMINLRKINTCKNRIETLQNGKILHSVLASGGSDFPDVIRKHPSQLFVFRHPLSSGPTQPKREFRLNNQHIQLRPFHTRAS